MDVGKLRDFLRDGLRNKYIGRVEGSGKDDGSVIPPFLRCCNRPIL